MIRLGKLVLSLNLLLNLPATLPAADKPLRFAYSAIDTSFLPAWVAKDAGFFDKNKLPLELISLRSSPLCISAHIADFKARHAVQQ